jgi:hypothetical protein
VWEATQLAAEHARLAKEAADREWNYLSFIADGKIDGRILGLLLDKAWLEADKSLTEDEKQVQIQEILARMEARREDWQRDIQEAKQQMERMLLNGYTP